jgi:hypothetical protein
MMMMSFPNRFRDLRCCNSDGCNYKPVVGPSIEDVGASPALMCQLLGVRVNEFIPAIAATSNCGDGKCYNMTTYEMKEYIGSPKMVPLEPNHFSCIDGRHDNEIVATPAGDMGIFLSSVFVYINATSAPMDFTVSRIKVLVGAPQNHFQLVQHIHCFVHSILSTLNSNLLSFLTSGMF